MREIAAHTGAPLVNVNLEISRRLLDLTGRQRTLRTQRLLDGVAAEAGNDVVLLDNIELLFDATLRQDPLRLLQGLSRHRTVAVAWNGSIEDGHIHYAAPGHPEYRRYPAEGVPAVCAEAAR